MATSERTAKKFKIKHAPKYCNVFYNNDVTTVEFVSLLLKDVFNLSQEETISKVNEIHNGEKGVVYINSKEVCDYKHEIVNHYCFKFNETQLKYAVEVYEEENQKSS
jgi:ATP-dependent Clp protease adapter protein ClpS